MHSVRLAVSFARARAGSNIAARMAMMAMTTKSSISVKPHAIGKSARKHLQCPEGRTTGVAKAGRCDCDLIGSHELQPERHGRVRCGTRLCKSTLTVETFMLPEGLLQA